MSKLAGRAEDIAAHLVSHALSAAATKFDTEGRQSAVDFSLEWPDASPRRIGGHAGDRSAYFSLAGPGVPRGLRWPASSGWEFRLQGDDLPYTRTRSAVLRAVTLCDRETVDALEQLPADVMSSDPDLTWLCTIGVLRRSPFKPGVVLLPAVRAEFVEASSVDFASQVEIWLELPHMLRHVEKLRGAENVEEKPLFLAPVDDVLPARFFTDDFLTPTRVPEGLEGVDGIWVWSNFWHRYLRCLNEQWR